MSSESEGSVRYADGSVMHSDSDLGSNGSGLGWGHGQQYSNQLTSNTGGRQGNSWLVPDWQYLVFKSATEIIVVRGSNNSMFFDQSGSNWVGRFSILATLTHDSGAKEYTLLEPRGDTYVFYDNDATHGIKKGRLKSVTTAGGVTASLTYNVTTGNLEKFEQGTGGDKVTYLYNYLTGTNGNMLGDVVLQVGGANVRRSVYSYYGPSDAGGNWNDLRTVVIQQWNSTTLSWEGLRTRYYRYYTSSAGSTGFKHGLKFIVDAEAWQRMTDAGIPPETATDAQLSDYASHYFEYDAQQRVTREKVMAGSLESTFAYTASGNADGYNSWKTKTVETRPDGSEYIVYTNYAMEVMLKVLKDGSNEWCDYVKYDATSGKAVQIASRAAVTSYDDTQSDLGVVLKASEGLITNKEWYTTTGSGAAADYLKLVSLQEGTGGTAVKQRELEYSGHSVGSDTVYQVSKQTTYRREASGGSDPAVTSFAYTYHAGTLQVEKKTTTLPVIPAFQNGDGNTYSTEEVHDLDGRMSWSKNELGFISHTTYVTGTGAMLQSIEDVDTTVTSGAPTGWTTVAGAGKNLVTDYESDNQGRITQMLGPEHNIDLSGTTTNVRTAAFTVYRDDIREVWTAQGYATGTAPGYSYTTVNPVSITRMDENGRTIDDIRAKRGTGTTTSSGRLSAADSFAQSTYLRWSNNHYDDQGRLTRTRQYFDIPTSGDGLNGTNYIQGEFGYDNMDRRNRAKEGEGTISRMIYDTRGLVTETWVGTDDTGATDSDPTGGGASGNNMVKVITNQYDGGNAGGNGLLTQMTQHVTASEDRVTGYVYDWRNRQIGMDGEESTYTLTHYDNWSRVTGVRQLAGSATATLLGSIDTAYDNLGRAYSEIVYGVDSSGEENEELTTRTWYDGAGRVIKRNTPGVKGVSTKTVYDSLNRPTATYLAYPENGAEVNSNNVSADIVVEQAETDYDDASNIITSRTYQRFHDAPTSGAGSMGALNGPNGANPKARIYTVCSWSDAIGRIQSSANYGTHGGSTVTRPSTVPSSSDTVLVSSAGYDAAGQTVSTTDPQGTVSSSEYDDLGRQVRTTENDTGGPVTADSNKITEFTYNLDSNLTILTCKNSETGDQVTRWVYGATLADSLVATTRLLRAKVYPDSDDATDPLGDGVDATRDRVEYEYNRAGELTVKTDQNGTAHAYDYDKLGSLLHDRVTAFGTGVDQRVKRISTSYNARRLIEKVTSYDNATVGSGNVLNEVEYAYDDFNRITEDKQSHGGATAATTPKVGYTYSDGSDNTLRLTRTTYPDGRQVDPVYGATNSMDDRLSRPGAIKDVAENLELASYQYLGVASPVIISSTQPGIELAYLKQGSESVDDAGDQYNGLDRFGRIDDQRWLKAGADIERVQYGYTRAGLRQWRKNPVATALGKKQDDYYTYDGLYQVKQRDRGTLNLGLTAISGTPDQEEDFTYDPTGNWDNYTRKASGTTTVDQDRTHNGANEIKTFDGTSAPVQYDAAGNMTTIPVGDVPADGHYEATWDAWNRLVRLRTPGAGSSSSSSSSSSGSPARQQLDASYEYDGLTRRTRRTTVYGVNPGTVDIYYNLAWKSVEERRNTDTCPERQQVYGVRGRNDLVCRDRYYGTSSSSSSCSVASKERHYALDDAMGSVTAITSTSGAVVERYSYTAFGESQVMDKDFVDRSLSVYDWQTRYHGEQRDAETGYYNYGYRYYLPELGKWPSRDPIGERGGENLYAFVGNDGVNRWDYLGLRIAPPPPPPPPRPQPVPQRNGVPTQLPPGAVPVLPNTPTSMPGRTRVTFYNPLDGEPLTVPYSQSQDKKYQDEIDKNDRRLVDEVDKIIPESKRREYNAMRVQLQESGNNIASLSVFHATFLGVSVVQVNHAWDTVIIPACNTLPRKCRGECIQMINKIKAQVAFFPPAGVVQGGNVARKQFCCNANKKIYRADLENLRGHNLKR